MDILKESQNRVKSMAMIHGILYHSNGLARIGFADYIKHLTTFILQSYVVEQKIIQIKTDVDDI